MTEYNKQNIISNDLPMIEFTFKLCALANSKIGNWYQTTELKTKYFLLLDEALC